MSWEDAAKIAVLFIVGKMLADFCQGYAQAWYEGKYPSSDKRHDHDRWALLLTTMGQVKEHQENQAGAIARQLDLLLRDHAEDGPHMIGLDEVPEGKLACEFCGGFHIVVDEHCPRISRRTERFEYRDGSTDITGKPTPLLSEVLIEYDPAIAQDLWRDVAFVEGLELPVNAADTATSQKREEPIEGEYTLAG